MKRLGEFLRPPIYEARSAEVTTVKEPITSSPFLPDNTDITVFYGGHSDRKDFAALKPYFAGVDIYISEIPAWTIEQIKLLSRISQGDRTARKELKMEAKGRKFNPFIDTEINALLGTGIRITVIDYSAEDKRANEVQRHFDNWGLLNNVVQSWNRTLDNIIAFARREAELDEYRENIMVRSIGPRLKTLIDLDPDLSKKEKVNVLIQQGAAHSYIWERLEALAEGAENTMITKVMGIEDPVFDHFDQLTHTFRTNTQASPQIRRDLAARAFRGELRYDLRQFL